MLSLNFLHNKISPLKVLCLGAHSDDIEIGCGGTILRLLSASTNVEVVWVVFGVSNNAEREKEARNSAALFLANARTSEVIVGDFRDGFLPFDGARAKDFIERFKAVEPDLILTHSRKDAHQDHRLIAELTWNTFRNHFILEYEIPKYDGDLGQPNVFVPLEREICERKIQCLMDAFATQRSKQWFERETFLALMRLRGMECIAPSGYAEAFYSRKLVL